MNRYEKSKKISGKQKPRTSIKNLLSINSDNSILYSDQSECIIIYNKEDHASDAVR